MRPYGAGFSGSILGIQYTGRRLDYETGWFVTSVKGLRDGASATPTEIARDGAEGQFDLPNKLSDPRIIEIAGIVFAKSGAEELERMERMQGALLALPASSADLRWHGRDRGMLSTHVRRGRGWEFSPTPSPRRATFLHRFRAPSQIYYGERTAPVIGVEIYLENRGTVPSAPTLTVTGNMPNGYAIYGPNGRVYQVASGIDPGNRDVIDMRTGLLVRDGIAVTGVYGQRNDVWEVEPGRTNQVLVPVTGSGQMSGTVRPAYF